MLLNIFDEKRPTEEPVRLTLRENLGSIHLLVVDENGDEITTILVVSEISNDIFLPMNVDSNLGFKLDASNRIKIRKEKSNG